MGVCIVFEHVDYLTDDNMALYISEDNILCYHIDPFGSAMLECSYFISHDYPLIQSWTKTMPLPN